MRNTKVTREVLADSLDAGERPTRLQEVVTLYVTTATAQPFPCIAVSVW